MTTEPYRELYRNCLLCPRRCGVNRLEGQRGFCGETSAVRIAWAGLHRGEEPPVSQDRGSGTIFFTGCTLRCAFCQNHQLSRGETGREVTAQELSTVMLDLEAAGAANINFVTGTHFIPGILEALDRARDGGMTLPVVWNSSGYETLEMARLLYPRVDLWLPDLKTLEDDLSSRLFRGGAYPEAARGLIDFILERMAAGEAESGITWEGQPLKLLIRHLILPGHLDSTRRVLEYFAPREGRGVSFSLMTQYTPVPGASEEAPRRILEREEAETAYRWLEKLGIEEGFFQGPPEGDEWLPDFANPEPFPAGYARKVWIWND